MAKFCLAAVAVILLVVSPFLYPSLYVFLVCTIFLVYALHARPDVLLKAFIPVGAFASGQFLFAFSRVQCGTRIASFGPQILTFQGLIYGITLGLRTGAIVLLAFLIVSTTDPRDLVSSLIHQLHVKYQYAYAVYLGYRYLPTLTQEYQTVRQAQMMRGASRNPFSIAARITPLLASVLRHSVLVAISLEARGFGASESRTYLHKTRFTKKDSATLLILSLLLILGPVSMLEFGLIPFLGPLLDVAKLC